MHPAECSFDSIFFRVLEALRLIRRRSFSRTHLHARTRIHAHALGPRTSLRCTDVWLGISTGVVVMRHALTRKKVFGKKSLCLSVGAEQLKNNCCCWTDAVIKMVIMSLLLLTIVRSPHYSLKPPYSCFSSCGIDANSCSDSYIFAACDIQAWLIYATYDLKLQLFAVTTLCEQIWMQEVASVNKNWLNLFGFKKLKT